MSQICSMLKNPVITWKLGHRQNSPTISRPIISLLGALAFLWTWRHLAAKVGTSKGGESNCKLPLRTSLERSVPEPYRSPDWALVRAKTTQGLNTTTTTTTTTTNNNNNNNKVDKQD
jgi:hypothetical protein